MLTTPAGVTLLPCFAVAGDVKVAGRVEGQGVGSLKPGRENRTSPLWRDLADRVAGVGDEEVAGRVEGQAAPGSLNPGRTC